MVLDFLVNITDLCGHNMELKLKYINLYGPDSLWEYPKEWEHIVDKILDSLQPFSENVKVGEIKEKFGGLRVYLDFYNIEEMTDEAFSAVNSIITLGEWVVEGYEIMRKRTKTSS